MIHIKSQLDMDTYRASAGDLSKRALRLAGSLAKPGTSTKQIDQAIEGFIRQNGAKPGFKGYGGFPGSICASINDEVVHGIPSPEVLLRDGDIISVDVGANKAGWAGDNAWTFYVGTVSDQVKGLCECARDCLKDAIEQAVPGNRLGDVGYAVQSKAEKNGYGVVRDYVGHGVGHSMHEDPNVPNYGKKGRGVLLQVGMLIAIEPMLTLGLAQTHVRRNGWTVVTDDGLPAAHYENTIGITKDGPVILTQDSFGPWCRMQGGKVGSEE